MNHHLHTSRPVPTLVRRGAVVLAAATISTAGAAHATTVPGTEPTGSPAGSIPAGEFDQALFDLLPGSVQDSGVLRFGALWETPPTIGVDPADTSTPVGVAPDIADAIEPILGVEIEWQNMQWPAQLPGVQSGAVDALFGQVTITAEREASIVDLVPWSKTTEALLVPADNPNDLSGVGDACGLVIGVPVGSTQGALVDEINAAVCDADERGPIEAAEYQGATAAISALQAGTIDGWINATASQEAVVAAQGDAFTVVEIPETESPPTFNGIAIAKDQPGITEAVTGALGDLIDNGSYQQILEGYGLGSMVLSSDELVVNPLTGTEVGAVDAS